MTASSKPRRPGSISDDRDRRRSDSAGLAIPVEVDPESTPPPQVPPTAPTPGRTPTPSDLEERLARLSASHNHLSASVWDARNVDKRIDRVELELKDNTRSTVRQEAILAELVVPSIKQTMAKLDTCLHHIAASSNLGTHVAQLGEKIDGIGGRLGSIEREQALAAERFESHDQRDQEVYAKIAGHTTDIDAIKQRLAIGDATAKVKRSNIRPWWFSSKGVVAVVTGIAAAIAAVIAATQGGCT